MGAVCNASTQKSCMYVRRLAYFVFKVNDDAIFVCKALL